MKDARRDLPSVNVLLETSAVHSLLELHPRQVVLDAVRSAINAARNAGQFHRTEQEWIDSIAAAVRDSTQPSLRRVINATGVVLHTNLGRAPLADVAIRAIEEVAQGFSNLEYDLETGAARIALLALRRSSSPAHRRRGRAGGQQLRGGDGAGAECAGAEEGSPRLAGRAGRDRRELQDPGHHGAQRSQARRGGDNQPNPRRRLSARDHAQNGRDRQGSPQQLHDRGLHHRMSASSAWRSSPPSTDCRSSTISGAALMLPLDEYGLTGEPTAAIALASRATLVLMSGDKLLGGPQAGIILGSAVGRRETPKESVRARDASGQAHAVGARGDSQVVSGAGARAEGDPRAGNAQRRPAEDLEARAAALVVHSEKPASMHRWWLRRPASAAVRSQRRKYRPAQWF